MKIRENLLNWADTINNKKLNLMTDDELSYLDVPSCQNIEEEMFVQSRLIERGAIPLQQLEVGKIYIGFCRNASEAIWQGNKFVYKRTKWGNTYVEEINHFQNDDGYDVFVPVKEK